MIETVSKDNLHEVLPLIRCYQEFYQVPDIDNEKNATFFSQFGESNPAGCLFLYRDKGKVVGFATIYFSFTSTTAQKTAVMSDLFTIASCRGKGVGRQLIQHCYNFAAEKNALFLKWGTAPNNTTAQRLYDSFDVTSKIKIRYIYTT